MCEWYRGTERSELSTLWIDDDRSDIFIDIILSELTRVDRECDGFATISLDPYRGTTHTDGGFLCIDVKIGVISDRLEDTCPHLTAIEVGTRRTTSSWDAGISERDRGIRTQTYDRVVRHVERGERTSSSRLDLVIFVEIDRIRITDGICLRCSLCLWVSRSINVCTRIRDTDSTST